MIANRFKKTMYLAKRVHPTTPVLDSNGNEVISYLTPVMYRIDYMPVTGYTEVLAYGEKVQRMYKAVVSAIEFSNIFREGDLAYLDGVLPTGEIVNGGNANYRVTSVRTQQLVIQVYFERLQKSE